MDYFRWINLFWIIFQVWVCEVGMMMRPRLIFESSGITWSIYVYCDFGCWVFVSLFHILRLKKHDDTCWKFQSWSLDIVKDLNMMEHDGTYTFENWWINFNKIAPRYTDYLLPFNNLKTGLVLHYYWWIHVQVLWMIFWNTPGGLDEGGYPRTPPSYIYIIYIDRHIYWVVPLPSNSHIFSRGSLIKR